MGKHLRPIVLVGSLALNVLITVPGLLLLAFSSSIQFALYQNILAPRFGRPDVVFIGDSITRGGGLWGLRIGRYDFTVWNYAHDGFMTRQVLVLAKQVAAARSRVAFVMAGTNDPDQENGREAAIQSAHYYFELLDTLIKANVEPVIQLTIYRQDDPNTGFIDELNAMLVAYAKEHNLKIIDLNRVLAPKKSLLPKYSLDGVHLTEAAYDVWAEEVQRVLSEVEARRSRTQ